MKQLFRFWIAAALLIVAGCVEEYDDSEVWNSINALEKRMTAAERSIDSIIYTLMPPLTAARTPIGFGQDGDNS